MPYRQLVFSLFTLFAFFNAAFSQTENKENFVIKPGQKVYILAVKGECGNTISPAMVNGRVLVIPGEKTQAGTQRKTLSYAQPFPPAVEAISQAIEKNKTFVIVNSPSQADFIFHVCVAYTEDLMFPEAMQRMGVRSELAFAEARVVPAALYLADKENIFSPMWKANTPDANRPVPTGNSKEDKKKKEKINPAPQANGMMVINGALVKMANASNLPDLEDLVKYFLKDYPKLAAVKIPKGQTEATIVEDPPRPSLSNKPDDAPSGKLRPTLVNKAGESLSTAKTETTANPNPETEEVIKIDTALIYVPVRVLDKDGKYIPNLVKKDFKVIEDGSAQEIENFSNVDDPFHVVLLLDMSGSTRFKIEEIQDAALEFIEQLRPQDRVMVASFESAIFVDADFTNDRAKLTKAILRTHTGGGTRLYDAVDLVLTERLNRIQGRKAVVLFSDGIDSASKIANVQSNLSKIEESNALFYPIHYNTLPDASNVGSIINGRPMPMSPQQIEAAKARNKETSDRSIMYMSELAIRSGGRFYEAENLTDAKTAFANIAEELRRQYWLSYYSTNPKDDGSYRKIRVVVSQSDDKKWAVRAKNGYRAPKR